MLGKRALKAGQSICGGWRGAFDSWTGDWKERALSHCFIRRNYQSTQVCDQCLAVKPFARTPQNLLRLVFTDFSETAPWRSTLQSHDEYVQNTPVDQRTPWLDVPGFVISRVKWDSAHTILLGTGKDLAASVLFDFDPWLYQVAVWSNILGVPSHFVYSFYHQLYMEYPHLYIVFWGSFMDLNFPTA